MGNEQELCPVACLHHTSGRQRAGKPSTGTRAHGMHSVAKHRRMQHNKKPNLP